MKYCKTKFIRKFAQVMSAMLLLNSVFFISGAIAAQETEKKQSNKVIMLLGKEMHICASNGSKTISINEYIDLFNAKFLNDAGKSLSLKKLSDSDLTASHNTLITYSASKKNYSTTSNLLFAKNSLHTASPRSPPVTA